jgi:type I restriction enzyme, R subunit
MPTEATTRTELIDPSLAAAGWDVRNPQQVGLEIPVDGFDPQEWLRLHSDLNILRQKGLDGNITLPSGISDYVLYRENGEILAIVEAKRTSIDPRLAEAQATFYVNELAKRQSFAPFAFLSNGLDTHFVDVGRANRRLVRGFFSPEDLENLLYLRQNRKPFAEIPINTAITDRSYQLEAIRRVGEAFETGKRKALLVMATGTGKTRTAMSLVDVFIRANQARRILFVADRDALVTQALKEGFEEHIPTEPCARLLSHRLDKTKRLYTVTLQTLSNIFQEFTPAFFDLIIFDEVHRSIFNRWNEVLQYFDARMVGLTATPAGFLDRNTFLEFECYDEKPTFLYSYEQATDDKHLVEFHLYGAQTRFQRAGILGVNLGEEERNSLIEQGIDPDELDYAGTDLERRVSNTDTLRRQWQEFMDVCRKDESGQLPGKTIVFAMTQEHAVRLQEAFAQMYPQFPHLVQVITNKSEYKGTLIEKFKKQSQPRIAISVDMLETGVNVPEVVNLVFMRPVHSRIKLTQMIGRGTRNHAACKQTSWLPNGRKEDFLIIDFWENDFSKQSRADVAQSLPVLVSLFNTRLKILEQSLGQQWEAAAQRTVADLREMIQYIPRDSFSVKQFLPAIEQVWEDGFWAYITQDKLDFLRVKVGPLLRYAGEVDVQSATFAHKVERLKLAGLEGRVSQAGLDSIREDVSRLPAFVREEAEQAAAIDLVLSPALETATPAQLSRVIDALAPQMRNRRERPDDFRVLDLRDVIASRGYILLFGGQQEIYVTKYRELVEERVLNLAANHPTVRAIERGEAVSDEQLLALERTLRQALGGPGLELNEGNIRKAYGLRVGSLIEFVREFLAVEGIPDYAELVRRRFEGYIASHPAFNANQIRFLRAVQTAFVQKRRLRLPDLYDAPLDLFGENAVERWFTPSEIEEMLALAEALTV